jgi:hypothetical protein
MFEASPADGLPSSRHTDFQKAARGNSSVAQLDDAINSNILDYALGHGEQIAGVLARESAAQAVEQRFTMR